MGEDYWSIDTGPSQRDRDLAVDDLDRIYEAPDVGTKLARAG